MQKTDWEALARTERLRRVYAEEARDEALSQAAEVVRQMFAGTTNVELAAQASAMILSLGNGKPPASWPETVTTTDGQAPAPQKRKNA